MDLESLFQFSSYLDFCKNSTIKEKILLKSLIFFSLADQSEEEEPGGQGKLVERGRK